MDSYLVKQLLQLNHDFYSQFSGAFSASRPSERLNLEPLQPYLANGIRLLDVGCGNGRLARAVDGAGHALDYWGVDGSAEFIAIADQARSTLTHVHAQFAIAELTEADWAQTLASAAPFDLIVSLAVLQHIPGQTLRVQLLCQLADLLKPAGTLVLSNWQFNRSERLRAKVIGWDTLGIDPANLEPNDYLLDWKRGGVGYRYVHLFTPAEIETLAHTAGLQVISQFDADANLNLFSILCKPS